MTEANKRQLGQTNLEITPIGLGVMQFAGGHGMMRLTYPPMTADQMDATVRAALDGGVNWFDTAEFYGQGRSEQGLAQGLQAAGRRNGDVIIATKWWPLFRTAASIGRTIDERCRHLAPFDIDLHQVHWPFGFSSVETEMAAMADLVAAGKIRAVGVSNHSAAQMRRAHAALAGRGLALASNQVHYSLLTRGIESNGILDTAKELGITIICWSPLRSGLLTGKFHRDPTVLQRTPLGRRARLRRQIEKSRPLVEALDAIAADRGVTTAQVALNWLINFHGETVVAIPGASKPDQARESAAAMDFTLTAAEMARVDELSRQFR